MFFEQVLVQVSECSALLRCVGLLQRTPEMGSLTQTSEFLEEAPVLPARDNMITPSLESTSCLNAGIVEPVASIRFEQGKCPSFALRVRFLGKAATW